MAAKIRKTTVVFEIVNQMAHMIQKEMFKPGERIPSERQLCETFQVSRSSLRSAIQHLAFNGLLEVRAGSGTYVCKNASSLASFSPNVVTDRISLEDDEMQNFVPRMECRAIIEPAAARLAALYATQEDLAELKEIINRMDVYVESSSLGGFYAEDANFHDRIARATGNQNIQEIINNYCVNVYYHLRSFGAIPNLEAESAVQHKGILEAIENRDAQRAERLMRDHILYSYRQNAKYVYHVNQPLREGVVEGQDQTEADPST